MSIAIRYGAGIVILHVLEDISPYADSLVINIVGEDQWKELREKNKQKILDTIKARPQSFCEEVSREVSECPFITDEISVRLGNPVEEILGKVEKRDCDMVVIGARGHGTVADAVRFLIQIMR